MDIDEETLTPLIEFKYVRKIKYSIFLKVGKNVFVGSNINKVNQNEDIGLKIKTDVFNPSYINDATCSIFNCFG